MNNIVEDEYLMYNTSPRIPISVCVDTSATANEGKVVENILAQIEKGINNLYKKVIDNDMIRDCAEIAVVSYSDNVSVVQDYTCTSKYAKKINIPVNHTLSGSGDVGNGVIQALDLLENRKRLYKSHGVDYYRPWLIIISDGKPASKESKKNVAVARKRTTTLEKQNKLTILTIYINSNESTDVTNDVLAEITKQLNDKNNMLSKNIDPQIIGVNKIAHFFDWLCNSISKLAFENEIKLDFSGLTDWEDI